MFSRQLTYTTPNSQLGKDCGGVDYVQRKVEYVYRHKGRYMVFRGVPAEVCLHCGTRYFAADVILAIEKRFFEIYEAKQQPAKTILVPVEAYA
ncbi:MAG: type II toxin-antitoxin system MqsA family antitoxin [Chloroflexota bacterium]